MHRILPVSLIVTSLNEAQSVAPFFASIADGSKTPEEIVVCDGGSRDDTMERIGRIHIPGTAIVAFSVVGANIAQGRNAAIARAKHDVIAITDFGCDVDEEWLELITEPLRTDPRIDVVAGSYQIVGRTRFENMAAAAELRVQYLDPESFLPSSRSFAIRRQAFVDAGRYPEHLSFAGEDTALCLQLKRLKKEFAVRFDATVSWFPRSSFSKFIRQHFLYGIGDGESRSRLGFYAKTFVKWLVLVAAIICAVPWPWFLLAWIAAVGVYYVNLRLKYGWTDYGFGVSLAAFFLIAVKELSFLSGFAKGYFKARKRDVRK